MFCKKVLTRVGCCASVTLMARSTQWMALWTNKQSFAILQFTEISRKLREDKDEEGEGQGDTLTVTKVPLKNIL